MSEGAEVLQVAGREIVISNPEKVLFPQAGHTKLDLARYYLAVAEGALGGSGGRPNVLVGTRTESTASSSTRSGRLSRARPGSTS